MDGRPAVPDREVVAARHVVVGLVLSIGLRAAAVPALEADPTSRWAHTLSDRAPDFSLWPTPTTGKAGRDEGWTPEPWLANALVLNDADPAGTPGRDWAGLGIDTAFLLGYQLALTGILWVLPSDVSNWSEAEKERGFENWLSNVKEPEWDADSWWINYVFHPYFGAAYYIRARERGFDQLSAFAYSALASAMYEFGVESFFEKPSIQDLIVTPVGGALLGAFVFEPIRDRIKRKPQRAWYDHVGLIVTDPIGALNGAIGSLFGIKSDVRVHLRPPSPVKWRERAVGLEVAIPW
jgi:Domain of unknown function (DUF3943)